MALQPAYWLFGALLRLVWIEGSWWFSVASMIEWEIWVGLGQAVYFETAVVLTASGSKPPPTARYSATHARLRSSAKDSCADSEARALRRASSSSTKLASPWPKRDCVAARDSA